MNKIDSATEATEARRWQRLKDILANALEQESYAAQLESVERSCADDLELMREAESLLDGLQAPESHWADNLDECAENAPTRPFDEGAEIGERIGAYVIVRRIAEGGMGAVFLAERADGCFEKQVAIKLLMRGANSDEIVRRFRSEREVLARLDHPNIARLIDAGTTNDGRLYFVMEYIDGVPVTDFVAHNRESLAVRLELFLKIAAAVEAAHRHSIIHRDLKPSNILVNNENQPKLLDFGIAKLTDDAADRQQPTAAGWERLTPVFASPEQARGEAVTVSTDVYSLGVVLYEILTGGKPFRFENERPSNDEIIRTVCQQIPMRPSLVSANGIESRLLTGDVDAILLRALQKEPAARYESVAEFAGDVRNYLQRKPVRARAGDTFYRIRRILFQPHSWQIALALIGLGLVCFFALPARRSYVSPPESEALSAGGTSDVTAERLFVQAFQLVMRGSEPDAKESLLRAVSLSNDAIARDSNFLAAYGLLVTAHLDLYWQGFDHTPARRDMARVALEKTEKLGPNSGEAHLARAKYAYNGFRDYERALSELKSAAATQQNRAVLYVFNASIYRRMGRWNETFRNFDRAIELGPTNSRYRLETGFTHEGLRNYAEARKFYERALTVAPHSYFTRAQIAQVALQERADPGPLRSELTEIVHQKPEAASEVANALFNYALASREEAAMAQALSAIRPEGMRDIFPNSLWPKEWFVGLIARMREDKAEAQEAFSAARHIEEKAVHDQPDYAPGWSRLGVIDAALGRKEDAIREARHACELLPLSQDAWDGPSLIINLAMVYALTGETSSAIDQLAIAAQIPAGVSYGELKLYPQWDSLRGDPRFQKILASLTPK